MKRARRNRRTRSTGSAPVPTPVMFGAYSPTSNADFFDVVPADLQGDASGLPFGTMSGTNVKSTSYVKDTGTSAITAIASVEVIDDGGFDRVRFNFEETLPAGNYVMISPILDNAVRGKSGQWLVPFGEAFTIA